MKGPYVLAALFCEGAALDENSKLWIREAFGLSIARPADPLSRAPGMKASVRFFARLVGGGLDGDHTITLRCDTAKVDIPIAARFFAEAEDMPADINCQVTLRILDEGTHWFDLAIDGRVLTRIPLRVLRESSLLGL